MRSAAAHQPLHPAPAPTDAPLAPVPIAAVRSQRMLSLDVFRGITMAAMILVNNPGSFQRIYPWLDHATWNGARPADLIFPFFLFIVGVAITLSLGQHHAHGAHRRVLLAIILRRVAILFALGALLNGFPFFDWDVFRIPGVLQRIALCYGAAAGIALTLEVRGQLACIVVLLAGYWALLMLVPVPGFGPGDLAPDDNLAAYLDRALMSHHLLHHQWDPEGLLSTLPAIATTLIGVLTGQWLRAARSASVRLGGLLLAGGAGVLIGLMMGRWFPINKSLWSSSYTVFTAGAALLCIGACYWLIDLQGYRRWTAPFVIYGTNPIIAYFGSSLAAKALELFLVTGSDGAKMPLQRYLFETIFLPIASPRGASFLYALANVLFWLGVTAVLYRKRIFIKV